MSKKYCVLPGLLTMAVAFSLPGIALADTAKLHAGDKVDVLVYNHPELSSSPTIDAQGSLTLALVGTIPSQGKTAAEVAAVIESRLRYFIPGAAVSVQVDTQNTSIFVSGGPGGILKYEPGETLSSALDQLLLPQVHPQNSPLNLGDAQPRNVSTIPNDIESGPVDYHNVRVLRDGNRLGPFDMVALRQAGEPGISLFANDTIELPSKPIRVRVTGEVAQPGDAHLLPSDPLMRAIDQVGGETQNASMVDVIVTRAGEARTYSLGDPVFTQPAESGDIIQLVRAPTVDVLGIVQKPGETLLRGNQTLVSAIYYAGGPAKYANLKAVGVIHNGVKTQYDLSRINKGASGMNPRLVDGDVVFVPQGSTFDPAELFLAISTFGYFFRP